MHIKKVLVAGTFDILHPGHIFLINEAAKLGEVHVIVATDKNRKKFSGELPIVPEEQRLEVIKNLKNVKEARLGKEGNNTLLTISEINPDIILLGPDQNYDTNVLRNRLKENGLEHVEVRRLNRYFDKYELNSSSLIKRKIFISKYGDHKRKRVETSYLTGYGKV